MPLAVAGKAYGQVALEIGELARGVSVGAQVVPKRDVVARERTAIAVHSDGSIRLALFRDVRHLPVEKQT